MDGKKAWRDRWLVSNRAFIKFSTSWVPRSRYHPRSLARSLAPKVQSTRERQKHSVIITITAFIPLCWSSLQASGPHRALKPRPRAPRITTLATSLDAFGEVVSPLVGTISHVLQNVASASGICCSVDSITETTACRADYIACCSCHAANSISDLSCCKLTLGS